MTPDIEWLDGYPTEDSLTSFNSAKVSHEDAGRVLRLEMAKCAQNCCASYSEEPGISLGRTVILCHFSTGGWSGAEDVMEALLTQFWIRHYHVEWRRGGHYLFEVPV